MNIIIVGKRSLSVTIRLKLCLLTVFTQNSNSGSVETIARILTKSTTNMIWTEVNRLDKKDYDEFEALCLHFG